MNRKIFWMVAVVVAAVLLMATCDGCGGDLWTDTSLNSIPVTKASGVTDQQANAAFTQISNAYNTSSFGLSDKNKINDKVKTIRIVPGNDVKLNGTTLEVGCNATKDEIVDYLIDNITNV